MPIDPLTQLFSQILRQRQQGPARAAAQLGQGISQGAGAIADQLRLLQQNARQDQLIRQQNAFTTDRDTTAHDRALDLIKARGEATDGPAQPTGPRPLNPLPTIAGGAGRDVSPPERGAPAAPPADTPGVDLMGTFIKAMQAGQPKTTAEAITTLKPKGLNVNAITRNARRVAGDDRLIDPILVPTEDGKATRISNEASEPFKRFAQTLGATITRFEQANGRPLTAKEFEEIALDTVRKRDQIEAISGISGVAHRSVPGLTVGPHGFLLNGRPLSERDLNNIRERFGGRLMTRPALKAGGFVPAETFEQTFPGDQEPIEGQTFPGVSPRKRNDAQDRRLRTQVFVEVSKAQSLPLFSEESVRELARLIAGRRGLK